jgi:Ras GTPase-activating-like protein IQGAP2/3
MRTGRPSIRPLQVVPAEALQDPETVNTFIRHLQELRARTDKFLNAILESLPRMPYGMRFIAKEVGQTLRNKFPHEPEENIIKAVGHLIYYRYLNPAIVAPEGFDVIDGVVTPIQRKNLAEISKMLNHISVGRLFDEENPYLQPLNEYVEYASDKFTRYFMNGK